MTQFQFELICKIIENGAPALAGELCTALDNLVQERNALEAELKQATAVDESTVDTSEQA